MTQPSETQAIMQGEHYWVKPPRAATDQKSCHDCGKPYEDHVLSVKLKKTRPQLTATRSEAEILLRSWIVCMRDPRPSDWENIAANLIADTERYVESPRTATSIQAAATRPYFCSCGGALTAEEYIEHYFEKGHDQGDPAVRFQAAAAEIEIEFPQLPNYSAEKIAAILSKHLGSAAVGEQTESVRYKDREARYAEVNAANSGGEQVRAEQAKAAGDCANCGAPIVEAFATGIGVYWYHVRGLAYCDTDNPSFDRTATPTSTQT